MRRFALAVTAVVMANVLPVRAADAGTGPSWTIQSTPNPPGAKGSQLFAVSCPSTSACAAVGSYTNSSGVQVPLAERWNGSTWTIQSIPKPTGAASVELRDVSCSSPSVCTMVGFYTNSSGAQLTLAERWNGRRWAVQFTPNPTGISIRLDGVSCPSTGACTAVGSYLSSSGGPGQVTLAEHWNGRRWAIQSTANPADALNFLAAVSCSSTTDCIAVGTQTFSFSADVTLAEHWNGRGWAAQSTPNPPGGTHNGLWVVSCSSASACTAVGNYQNRSGNFAVLAERWNGSTWTIQSIPNGLNGVSCSSTTACTAVGGTGGGTLAERWNGSSWVLQSTRNPTGSTGSVLTGVSCPSTTVCTAVGNYQNSSGVGVTLAERYS